MLVVNPSYQKWLNKSHKQLDSYFSNSKCSLIAVIYKLFYSLSLFKLLKILNMNVKPATISMKFELMALLNHIPPMGKDNGKNVANGTYSEKRKQGMNTQISKGKFILMVHFFYKNK